MSVQLLILLSLVISLAVPFFLGGSELWHGLAQAPAWVLIASIFMVAISWSANAFRLRILAQTVERPVSFRSAFTQVIATEFAGAASPAGAGGPVTYVFLLGQQGFKPAHAAAMYAVDHLIDGFFFATMLPALAILTAAGGMIDNIFWLLLIAVLLIALGLLLFWAIIYRYRELLSLGDLIIRPLALPKSRRRKVTRIVLRFRHGLHLVAALPQSWLLALYLCCATHWLMRYSILAVIIWGLGFTIPWAYLFIVQGLVLFAGHLTFLPGGSGSVELGFSALLAPFIGPAQLALALLLWRFATFYWYLIAGAPVFIFRAGRPALAALWPGTVKPTNQL